LSVLGYFAIITILNKALNVNQNMEGENGQISHAEGLIGWEVPEYDKHERTKHWYTWALIAGGFLLVTSFFSVSFFPFSISYSPNFLFALIVIIGAIVIILNDGREPDLVAITITDEGVIVGRKFYDYDDLKDFSIIYKPREEIKNLYIEFKNPLKHRLSIPLLDMNPLPIRDTLLKYLPEDLDRLHPPASEGLARLFKL